MNHDNKQPAHFVASYFLQPTNPVTVNLIGTGGTGSQVLTALARINHALVASGHPGLYVRAFDGDTVAEPNLARQLFADAELGMNKAVALINRINRFFGTNWKAMPYKVEKALVESEKKLTSANLFITCLDKVAPRFEVAEIIRHFAADKKTSRDKPYYWLDFGNSRYTGQAILGTVGEITQPNSKKYLPVGTLPFITDEFKDLLWASEAADDTPSCSLAEALTKQDLFINTSIAAQGASLIWSLFQKGIIHQRGFFVNLLDYRSQPLPISAPHINTAATLLPPAA